MSLLRRLFRRALSVLEHYFLGPQLSSAKNVIALYWLADEPVEFCAHAWAHLPRETAVVMIAPDPHDGMSFLGDRTNAFFLRPHSLEDVVPMLKKLRTLMSNARVMIIAHELSMLPNKNTNALSRAFLAVKRYAHREHFDLVVIDHEATLGKKNSALLGRLFLEHSITEEKTNYLASFLTTIRSFSNNTFTRPPLSVPNGASGKRKNAVPAASFCAR